tara:strand:+ start:1676 stop:3148 length:1473 start_codon:yes stop_codon:yes gene_type:complete
MELPKIQTIDNNKSTKKKILLLSDDFRLPSGIGTISREIILKTVHHYDWIQLGAALQHPEHGKAQDVSKQIQEETGIADADVKVIPWTGYGDRNVLFSIINQEKPDVILHFTDPRYWTWLYSLEHEIKTTYGIPIAYYSIWDDLPYPMWNAPYYGSCDLIMGISKQSDNIHREVLKQNGFGVYDYDKPTKAKNNDIITGYVPHGLDHNIYKPLPDNDPAYVKILEQIKTNNDAEFVVFWNNRNIRRKQPADVILSFKMFNDMLPEETRSKTMLLMHTSAVDTNGTDLRAVAKHIAPNCKIVFSETKLSIQDLNAVYNSVDVVINIASNEGWGLSSTEALLSGTPIINNVTGGLQDQCGFRNEHGNLIEFTQDFPTNHKAKYADHGVWVKPIFPSNRSIQGSVATPFIFDDRVQSEHVAVAIYDWYITEPEQRKAAGLAGREFCLENGLTSEQMGNKMIEMMDMLISRPITRPRYTFNKVEEKQYENIGIA